MWWWYDFPRSGSVVISTKWW